MFTEICYLYIIYIIQGEAMYDYSTLEKDRQKKETNNQIYRPRVQRILRFGHRGFPEPSDETQEWRHINRRREQPLWYLDINDMYDCSRT